MFDKQELAQLGTLFETHKKDIVSEVREETKALIAASESRIIFQITDFIDSRILTQIDELNHEVAQVKQHIHLV